MSVQSVVASTVPPHAAIPFAASGSREIVVTRGGDVLACGFGMTVAAWLTAYVSRMPLVNAPGQVTVFAMLGTVFFGGFFAARYSKKGIAAALLAGALSGVLDILIVGSILHDSAGTASVAPAAALWIGGSILFNALLAGAGGLLGMLLPSPERERVRWSKVFATVLTAATLLLIIAGGLVTAFHAGLAVPDWPESYGYNMFLFPLSKMQSTQGNFYEHSHRLMGSLVGFTSLTLAIYLSVADRRRWVKVIAWAIFLGVCIQGILGGTRVVERSVPLAMMHGILAQLLLASMAALAAVTSRTFTAAVKPSEPPADRQFTLGLVGALVIQLMLGALLRHEDMLVMLHVTMAVVVTVLALFCGFRAWGLYGQHAPIRNSGIAVMLIVFLQLFLGIIALLVRSGPHNDPTMESALTTTAHQANGALLLAVSTLLCVWTWRLATHVTAETMPEVPGTDAVTP